MRSIFLLAALIAFSFSGVGAAEELEVMIDHDRGHRCHLCA